MEDELKAYLKSLEHDECYRVERILKEGSCETTELVYFKGADGSERGPFVRKRFPIDSGLGGAYQRILDAQEEGRRFAHLPRIEECYTAGDSLVVVSEYIRGETLADVVYRCDPSLALAADVFPRICEAVGEMHESFDPPLIHRDLKPSNIILSQGSLSLIDFGIARTYDEEADSDTLRLGTRAYAPPEQFGYGQTDERSDVYALGMLLYYCLTERTPDAAARKAGWRAPGIPEPVRAVIEKAAAFDPRGRFASARELSEAFSRALQECALASVIDGAHGSAPHRADDPASKRAAVPSSGRFPLGRDGHGAAGNPLIRASRALSRMLSRVPRWLGNAWDVFIVLFSLLAFAACVNSALNPDPATLSAGVPVGLRMLSYLLMFFLMYGPLAFAVCDRRPLYRVCKRLATIPVPVQLAVCAGVFVVGFVATGLSATLPLPA